MMVRGPRITTMMTACLMAAAAISGGAATAASAQTAPEAPANLQVNLLTNPMAVPLTGVHFSWATRDSRAGQSQQGYEIRVASSPSTVTSGSAKWDSGEVRSSAPVENLNATRYPFGFDTPSSARERTANDEGDSYIHQRSQAAISGDSAEARYSTLVALKFMAGDPQSITEYRQLAPVAALANWWQTGDAFALAGLYADLKKMLLPVGSDGLVNVPITSLARNDAVFGQPGQPPPDIPEDSGIGAGPLNGALPPPSSGGTAPPAPNAKVSGYPTTLVDWPPNERDGFVFERENTVVNAFAYAAYNAMAQIAATTGNASDASSYAALAARLKSAIQSNLYDPATGAFYDGVGTSHEAIQSSSYVVALGAASPVQAQTAARYIASRGITPARCSVYCAAYLLEALYDGGQAQAALNILTASTTTSWLNMIAQGAGSTMEAWNPAIKGNLSYSHAWATSPDFVVPEYLFGISPLTPGWSSAGQQVLVDGTAMTATARQAPSGQAIAVVPVSSGTHTVAAVAAGGE